MQVAIQKFIVYHALRQIHGSAIFFAPEDLRQIIAIRNLRELIVNIPIQRDELHVIDAAVILLLWTESDPYQDIFIMVFTRAQWPLIERSTFIISAAPFGPEKLGENKKYV